MHRVACSRPQVLTSTASHTVRTFSNPPPPAPLRKPVAKWGNVVIPSRQEVNEIKARRQTDINYLKFENESSLAARLARPTIDITLARQQAQAKEERAQAKKGNAQPTKEPVLGAGDQTSKRNVGPNVATDATSKVPRAKMGNILANKERDTRADNEQPLNGVDSAQPLEAPSPATSVASTIEHMINLRREARLKRESARLALKQKIEEERQEREEREEQRRLNKKAKVHAAINEFRPLNEQIASTQPVDVDAAERRAKIMKLAAELAAKRKAARLAREVQEVASSAGRRTRQQSLSQSSRGPSSVKRREQEEFQIQLNEEATISNVGPEFEGPEQVSTNLFEVYRPAAKSYTEVANLQSGYIRGGDYSPYVPPTLASFATPPEELGAVRLAELTLSHRRDVPLPSRYHTVDLVAGALKPKSASKSA